MMAKKMWLLFTAFSILSLPSLNSHLTTTLNVSHSKSEAAQAILHREFGEDIEGTFTLIYKYKKASVEEIGGFKKATKKAATAIPGGEVILTRAAGGYFFALIQTSMQLPQAARYTEDLRTAVDAVGLHGALIGGPPAIKSDATPILNQDLLRGEIIGGSFALLILILLLGFSRTLLIPLIFTTSVTSISLGLLYLTSLVHPMALYLPNIITLISLGLCLDYSLLVIYRYRNERKGGRSHEEALSISQERTLKIVGTSSALIAGCLLFLFLIDVPFIRSLTLGLFFVPCVAWVATRTLLPDLLARYGDSSVLHEGLIARKQKSFVTSLSSAAIKQPILFLLISISLLSLSAIGARSFSATPSSLTTLPVSMESQKALFTLSSRLGDGIITPHILIIESVRRQNYSQLENSLARLDEVIATASAQKGRFFKIYLVTKNRLGSEEDQRFVQRLRNLHLDKFGVRDAQIYLAGAPAQGYDLLKAIDSKIFWIALFASLLLLLTLWRLFDSIVLAFKALVMDALSLLAVLGGIVLFVRNGIGTYQLDQVEAWSILLTLTLLFGLSIDYEIFIVSRIKEAHDRGLDNRSAIEEGLHQTSVVVTAAGLILIGALSGFLFGHFAGVQQLGLGLLIGIILDITIVRLFFLPSAMVLLGKWNWWRKS